MLTKLRPSLAQIFPQLGDASLQQVTQQVGRRVLWIDPETGEGVSVVWVEDFHKVSDQAWVEIIRQIREALNAN